MTTGDHPANDWLRDLFERTPDGVVILDDTGCILHANLALARIFGLAAGELTGRRLVDLVTGEPHHRWEHDLEKLLHGDWTLVETNITSAARRDVSVEICLVARTACDGRPAAILHLHDLSVYRTVERALVASQRQWERSFDAITDCMCILDRTGNILRANRAFLQRFATAPHGDLIGRDYRAAFVVRDPGAALPDAIQASPFVRDEVAFTHVPGRFNVAAYPLRTDNDSREGAILILRDITEQCQTREALQKSESGLRQAAKMEAIGRLAGGIAHDFNNILTSILGYSSLVLRSMQADSPLREDLQEIVGAAERATALTRQLLDFSHDRAVETKIVNLNTIIAGMTKFLGRTLGEDIQTHMKLHPALWNIKADESRIEQIVMNLAINARDAMPRGGHLVIETGNLTADAALRAAHPELKAPRYVLMTVSDSGHGMPPHVLEHLFEPFFTTKERGKGTGLGLTTIYGIARQFGGHIACYSEVGKGTTFNIYLPQSVESDTPAAAAVGDGSVPRGTETVLVVDDEEHLVTLIAQMLTNLGYQVLKATTPPAALDLSRSVPVLDLVLSDIVMPRMSGIQLVAAIREMHPRLRALYMSGYAGKAAMESGILKPDTNFIQKPFSIEALARLMRTVLDKEA